eukprot:GGOE01042445.1.p1 GENE.GGOE01042445.1~~GGOE01042445.1.p1  ORF type:complete len:513 (-),score=109.11 GGOE01042445.1:192-1679(-)
MYAHSVYYPQPIEQRRYVVPEEPPGLGRWYYRPTDDLPPPRRLAPPEPVLHQLFPVPAPARAPAPANPQPKPGNSAVEREARGETWGDLRHRLDQVRPSRSQAPEFSASDAGESEATEESSKEVIVRERATGEVEVLGISPTNGPLDTQLAHQLYRQLDKVMQERDELLARLEEGTGGGGESRLREELRALRGENAKLKEQQRRTPAAASSYELQEAQREIEELRTRLAEAREELYAARAQDDQWRNEKAALEREFDHELHEAEKEIVEMEDQRDRLLAERERLESALREAQDDFDELSHQFNMLSLKYAERSGLPIPPPPPSRPFLSHAAADPPPPGAFPMAAPSVGFASPAKTDLNTGPVRGRGVFSPQQPAGALPWAHHARPGAAAAPAPVPTRGDPRAPFDLFQVIGVRVRVLDNAYDADEGILDVTDILPGSLAERAGMRLGDRIDKLNRHFVGNLQQLTEQLQKISPDSCLRLGVLRKGLRKQVIINLP